MLSLLLFVSFFFQLPRSVSERYCLNFGKRVSFKNKKMFAKRNRQISLVVSYMHMMSITDHGMDSYYLVLVQQKKSKPTLIRMENFTSSLTFPRDEIGTESFPPNALYRDQSGEIQGGGWESLPCPSLR